MRPAASYRAARRQAARERLKALRREGLRTDWRVVWAAFNVKPPADPQAEPRPER